jgi:hypothetical protein
MNTCDTRGDLHLHSHSTPADSFLEAYSDVEGAGTLYFCPALPTLRKYDVCNKPSRNERSIAKQQNEVKWKDQAKLESHIAVAKTN